MTDLKRQQQLRSAVTSQQSTSNFQVDRFPYDLYRTWCTIQNPCKRIYVTVRLTSDEAGYDDTLVTAMLLDRKTLHTTQTNKLTIRTALHPQQLVSKRTQHLGERSLYRRVITAVRNWMVEIGDVKEQSYFHALFIL